jgi:hypothetical protein
MPQAIPYIASAASSAGYLTAAEAALITIAATVVSADYQRTRAQERARRAQELERRGRSFTFRSAIGPRTIVLGTARVSGPMMYAEFVGDDQQYLDTIVAVNHGALASVLGVYIGDELIPAADVVSTVVQNGKYGLLGQDPDSREEAFPAGGTSATLSYTPVEVVNIIHSTGSGDSLNQTPLTRVSVVGNVVTWAEDVVGTVYVSYTTRLSLRAPLRVQWAMGTASQASTSWADVAAPKWTANHRLRGVAYVRTLKLIDHPVFTADLGDVGLLAYGPAGVWDPRTSTFINGTSNSALLAAWLRTQPRIDGGFGVPSAWIDWSTVATAANICDELITVKKLDGTGYEQVKRYECNTVISLDRSAADNLQVVLETMAGDFPFTGGLYKLFAGAFRTAAITLTDADVDIAAELVVGPSGSATAVPPNTCTATFYDKAKNYQRTAAPDVTNDDYVTADGSEEPLEIDLPGVTDARQANYLMGVRLERERPSLAAKLTVTGRGANLALLDTVQLGLTGYAALAGKTFEVRRRTNQWNGRYPIELREVRASTYALDADRFVAATAAAPPANAALYDVSTPAVLSADSVVQRRPDGSLLVRALVTWDRHPQAFVLEGGSIQVRWRAAGGHWVYEAALNGAAQQMETSALAAGQVVMIEVRALNRAGAPSSWAGAPLVVAGSQPVQLFDAFGAGPYNRNTIA